MKWNFSAFLMCICFLLSCQDENQITYQRYFSNGKNLYEQHCQNCHNNDGKGLGDLIPPLTDSTFLKRNKNKLACLIKNGIADTLIISSKSYNGKMPANPQLSDIETAEIITFITNSFENHLGLHTAEQVGKELKNCNR